MSWIVLVEYKEENEHKENYGRDFYQKKKYGQNL